MWDLNRAERRALCASVALVGLAGLGRLWWAPDPARVAWRDLTASPPPLDSVERALAAEARAQTPLAPGERVDVNVADRDELRRLPGVGPELARAIVGERERHPFASAEDLERVPGIGPVTRRRIEPHVTARALLSGPAGGARGPPVARGCGPDHVDLNRASGAELEALPGIGPALAARVIALRSERGRFGRPEEITAVRGIGPRSLERLLPRICAG